MRLFVLTWLFLFAGALSAFGDEPPETKEADPPLYIYTTKFFSQNKYAVDLPAETIDKIDDVFSPESDEENWKSAQTYFKRYLEHDEITEDEAIELFALRRAYFIYRNATRLKDSGRQLLGSWTAYLGFEGFDCGAIARSVISFVNWLDKRGNLEIFQYFEMGGDRFVHVVPVLRNRKQPESQWTLDAWVTSGPPQIFSRRTQELVIREMNLGPKL